MAYTCIEEQLDSIQEGIFEEMDGHRAQNEPESKTDRIVELIEKLDGLEEKTPRDTGCRINQAQALV